ncbi:MAG: tetratricopeptide repeat protein [Candidatus Binataceae bacterium]
MNRRTRTGLFPIGAMIALGALVIAAGCHRGTVADYLARGDAAMRAAKLSGAEAAYNEAAKLAPGDPRVHIALGNLYVFEHQPDLAQAQFMTVLTIDPRNAATHAALGNLYREQGHNGLAENQFRAAIALESDRPAYRLDLASLLRKEGKLADAEDQFRTAIGLNPRDAKSHLAMAELLESELGRAAAAKEEYDEARALNSKLLPAAAATTAATAATAAPSSAAIAAAPKIKALNKLFLLTKSSPVYRDPNSASAVVARVHRRKYVHVIGIAGNFLQIKLRDGTIGFIPASAAE